MALQIQNPDTTMSESSRTMSPASFSLPIRTTPSRQIDPRTPQKSEPVQTHLLKFYRAKSLGPKAWSCAICKSRATGLFHCSISKLYPFTSRIHDTVIPVCNAAGCNERGVVLANEFVKNGGMGEETTKCEGCEEKSRMKLCATCRFGRKWTFNSLWRMRRTDIMQSRCEVKALKPQGLKDHDNVATAHQLECGETVVNIKEAQPLSPSTRTATFKERQH